MLPLVCYCYSCCCCPCCCCCPWCCCCCCCSLVDATLIAVHASSCCLCCPWCFDPVMLQKLWLFKMFWRSILSIATVPVCVQYLLLLLLPRLLLLLHRMTLVLTVNDDDDAKMTPLHGRIVDRAADPVWDGWTASTSDLASSPIAATETHGRGWHAVQ